jgi:hypothetical protein
MNWWLVADLVVSIIFLPFYMCFITDMCSQAYFDAKLEYQIKYFDKINPTYETGEQ